MINLINIYCNIYIYTHDKANELNFLHSHLALRIYIKKWSNGSEIKLPIYSKECTLRKN